MRRPWRHVSEYLQRPFNAPPIDPAQEQLGNSTISWTAPIRAGLALRSRRSDKKPASSAGFPACGFTELSSSVVLFNRTVQKLPGERATTRILWGARPSRSHPSASRRRNPLRFLRFLLWTFFCLLPSAFPHPTPSGRATYQISHREKFDKRLWLNDPVEPGAPTRPAATPEGRHGQRPWKAIANIYSVPQGRLTRPVAAVCDRRIPKTQPQRGGISADSEPPKTKAPYQEGNRSRRCRPDGAFVRVASVCC